MNELALALSQDRNGFDRMRMVMSEKPEKKECCANNGKVIAHWAGSCKKYKIR
jgi:hypothetical protein